VACRRWLSTTPWPRGGGGILLPRSPGRRVLVSRRATEADGIAFVIQLVPALPVDRLQAAVALRRQFVGVDHLFTPFPRFGVLSVTPLDAVRRVNPIEIGRFSESFFLSPTPIAVVEESPATRRARVAHPTCTASGWNGSLG